MGEIKALFFWFFINAAGNLKFTVLFTLCIDFSHVNV